MPKTTEKKKLRIRNNMSDKKLVDELIEGQHYNTKMRAVESKGSRHIRMGIKEYKRMTENMRNKSHPSPSPKTAKDDELLRECSELFGHTMERLKSVKETKKKSKKNEAVSKSDIKFLKDDALDALKSLKDSVDDKDYKAFIKGLK